jgi:hypothetical protein
LDIALLGRADRESTLAQPVQNAVARQDRTQRKNGDGMAGLPERRGDGVGLPPSAVRLSAPAPGRAAKQISELRGAPRATRTSPAAQAVAALRTRASPASTSSTAASTHVRPIRPDAPFSSSTSVLALASTTKAGFVGTFAARAARTTERSGSRVSNPTCLRNCPASRTPANQGLVAWK